MLKAGCDSKYFTVKPQAIQYHLPMTQQRLRRRGRTRPQYYVGGDLAKVRGTVQDMAGQLDDDKVSPDERCVLRILEKTGAEYVL